MLNGLSTQELAEQREIVLRQGEVVSIDFCSSTTSLNKKKSSQIV